MKRYNIKNQDGKQEFIDILKESDNHYHVSYTRLRDGYIKTTEETISKQLFTICLQTGYLYQESSAA